jgi:hypothetical protein
VTSPLAFYDTKQIRFVKSFIIDTSRSLHGDVALDGKNGKMPNGKITCK